MKRVATQWSVEETAPKVYTVLRRGRPQLLDVELSQAWSYLKRRAKDAQITFVTLDGNREVHTYRSLAGEI